MIQIFPLDSVDPEVFQDLDAKNVYVTSLDLISALLSKDLPLKDNKKSIKHILSFLYYADRKMQDNHDTKIPIHRDTFIHYFDRNTYTKYLTILKELKVMTRVPYDDNSFYVVGKKPSLYRFHDSYLQSEMCLVIIETKQRSISVEVKVDKRFSSAILESEIDLEKAFYAEKDYALKIENDLIRKNTLRYRLSNLFNTHASRYIRKGSCVDRIFHSFFNVSKISREFLTVNGSKYFNLDIVNCQPMLLCYYLKSNNLQFDKNYIEDCEAGMLYEKFEGFQGNFKVKDKGIYYREFQTLDRENVKLQLYKSVYFNFDESNPINQEFKKFYPITHQTLLKLTADRSMASILQNVEASIFNLLRPRYSKYYFTLFDAIYFTDIRDRDLLKEDILSKFQKLNINPTVK
jgi:hypothetical protein